MIVKTLKIKNIGLIENETIELNKPLLLFYGDIRQGKTTILNAVRWVCGGAFPSDIIRHGQKEASVELEFEGGSLSRSWYVAKDGRTVKARDVVFVRDGKPVSSPVRAIQALLNPFLLDQDYLRNMTELERKRYFAELFKVDTTAIDNELAESERLASALRSEIRGYGEIALTPVEPVDAAALQMERTKVLNAHRAEVQQHLEVEQRIAAQNASVAAHNARLATLQLQADMTAEEIAGVQKRLTALKVKSEEIAAAIAANPEQQLSPVPAAPPAPDTSALDAKISAAAAANVAYENYQRELKRSEAKQAKQAELEKREKRQRELRAEKLSQLKEVSASTGIAALAFDENGEFTFQGTQAGMLSTSQIIRLSSALSSLYPEGFGIELLDRGESLGKSIFDYVERAKSEELTILATIVGEKPAVTPPEVGVFVVEQGKIKQ